MNKIKFFILRKISIIIIKYLQRKYKSLTAHALLGNQSNQVISRLKLIQSVLYFFQTQFHAWGYFHPSCVWSPKDEKYFRELFPEKDFPEVPIVVWHNPYAVTYYKNKIFKLSNESPPIYEIEIKKQLKKWKDWI